MGILTQFLLRLSFGLAAGMAVTSSRQVSSGFFRNHLYVTLGLTTLAALAAASGSTLVTWLAATAAVLSYVGSVCWLYEAKRLGLWLLWLLAACSLAAASLGLATGHETVVTGNPPTETLFPAIKTFGMFHAISVLTSGLVLGVTTAAMLLGHWYLNSPGMELAPLRRLLIFAAGAVGIQMFLSGAGLIGQWSGLEIVSLTWLLFVTLRWAFGLLGVTALLWMAWQTLKIPNTQSTTGILYVAVIGVFVGELTAMLLSMESMFPL